MVEVCRVSFLSTHGKSVVRRVPLDCRVLNPRHTAKVLFAVCPTLDTANFLAHGICDVSRSARYLKKDRSCKGNGTEAAALAGGMCATPAMEMRESSNQ